MTYDRPMGRYKLLRFLSLFTLTAVYILAMHLLAGVMGREIRIITVIPVLVWSIFAGLRPGLLYAGFCALLLTPLYMGIRFDLGIDQLYIANIPGIAATLLVAAIVGAYRDLHSKMQALNLELKNLNRTDGLTGLFNRRGVMETAERIYEIHRRRRETGVSVPPFACAIIDLDHFKQINDCHGHLVGDKVLRQLGTIFRDHFRGTDIVGRCGGEEFLVLLPDTGAEEARMPLEKLAAKVRAAEFQDQKGNSLAISFSAGVTQLNDEDDSFDAVFARADHALYRAKESGRDRIETTKEENEC